MSLVLDHVGYRYAGSADPVLEDISLTLTPGRVVGVAGRSESGKSTLCLVASGLAPAVIGGVVSGVIRLDERPTAGMKPYELATACGILFQNPVTQLSGTTRTVWEEIAFGPRNLGLEIDELIRRVEETAQALSIHGILARDPGRLSGGQAQLVALASVLAIRPRFIVLDEPTSQLDPIGTKLVARALAGLTRSRDVGILVVEQKPELLAELADELIVLEGGRIAASGRIADIQGDPGIGAFGIEPPASIRIRRAAEAAGRPIDSAVIG